MSLSSRQPLIPLNLNRYRILPTIFTDSDDSDAALEESSDEGWDDAEEDDSDEKMES